MTAATAFIHAAESRIDSCPSPVVFVDGVPEPALRVRRLRRRGPLDWCEAEVKVIRSAAAVTAASWRHRRAVVAMPWRLNDGGVWWQVLAHGELADPRPDAAGISRAALIEDWSRQLRTAPRAWRRRLDGALAGGDGPARLEVGPDANRSPQRQVIEGRGVHVLTEHGERWTVGQAIESLAAFAALDLDVTCLPHEVGALLLTMAIDLRAPVGASLGALLRAHDLVVRRERRWADGQAIERRWVVPAGATIVRVDASGVWSDQAGAGDQRGSRGEARAVVVRTAGPRVESTFALRPGWPAALEGGSSDAYSPRSNANFAPHRDVFRLWVLNEDGRFSAAPFDRGPGFDLAGLFEQAEAPPESPPEAPPASPPEAPPEATPRTLPETNPGALRFLPCLTRDASGAELAPILEASLDGGATWAWYAGDWRLCDDRGGVRLTDVDLPASFLEAARTGAARLRITASLRSPWPVEVVRWIGDPRRGLLSPTVFDVAAALSDARVRPPSIHLAALASGAAWARTWEGLAARRALALWQARRLMRRAGVARRLTLGGLWPALAPGQRLALRAHASRATITPDHAGGVIELVRLCWPDGEDRPRRAPVTRLSIIT